MLEQSHFLGDLLRVFLETVLGSNILLFSCRYLFPLVIVEVGSVLFNNNLSAIIEENATRVV